MPIKRTDKLPPYVYKRKSGYQLRVYLGKGQPMKAIMICPADAPISEVWKAYELHTKRKLKTLAWLLNEYADSAQFKAKSRTTMTYQQSQINRIASYKLKSGKAFGEIEIKLITSGAIRKYLDARGRDNAPTAGNREASLISAAWNWALERDLTLLANPCSVVKRNKEQPRTRYVSPQEYEIAYGLAEKYPYLQPAMEMAYLCRMRRGEILSATRAQILDEGFDTKRMKGSNDTITRWSERLTSAVNYDAGTVKSLFIVHDQRGQKITDEAFKSAWTRLKKLMAIAGIEPFNFHDLKAAGVSDFVGDKLQASGHKDPKMLKVYDRKKHTVDSTK